MSEKELETLCSSFGWQLETDNYGQFIIYTNTYSKEEKEQQ